MADSANAAASPATLLHGIEASSLAQWGIKFVIGCLLLWIGIRIGRWTADFEHRVLLRANVDSILAQFLRNVTYCAVLVLIFVSALDLTGFPTTTLLTALGAAGIAIGLALKDSLSNIASGVILIVLRPFHVGDTVKIAGQEGVIDGVYIFQTKLHTADNRDVVLMNSAVVGAPIINLSRRAERRLDLLLYLDANSDLSQALESANAIVAHNERIETDRPAHVFIADISDKGAALSLQVWCRADDLDALRADLLQRVHAAWRERGIGFVPPPKP